MKEYNINSDEDEEQGNKDKKVTVEQRFLIVQDKQK